MRKILYIMTFVMCGLAAMAIMTGCEKKYPKTAQLA